MRRLLDKYPDGIDSFHGSLEPTNVSKGETLAFIPITVENVGRVDAAQEPGRIPVTEARVPGTSDDNLQKIEAIPGFQRMI